MSSTTIRHRVLSRRELVKEADHVVAHRRPALGFPVQRIVVPQRAQDIDTFAMGQRFHTARLANRRPARLDRRIRTEAGFVKKQQLALAGARQLIEFADYAGGLAESFLWMLFFKL